MSILVTGSSGGIGGNVVRMLLEAGEEVVGFDVAPPGPGSVAADVADHFPLVLGSVTDLACLMRAAQHHGVEGIIHMAAMLFLGLEWRTHEMVRVNIEGTVNVLEATRLLGLPKMVYQFLLCGRSASRPFSARARGRRLTSSSAHDLRHDQARRGGHLPPVPRRPRYGRQDRAARQCLRPRIVPTRFWPPSGLNIE